MSKRTAFFIFLFTALFICLFCAEGQTAYVYLEARDALEENEPYVKDGRTYDRDYVEPSISGLERLLYKQTKDVNWYLFPLSLAREETPTLYLSLPCAKEITTAYLNGQPLSADASVEIDLTQPAELHVATEEKRLLIRLCFTNLPVLCFSYEGNLSKQDSEGTLLMIDPDYERSGWESQVLKTDVLISYRGDTSYYYSEKRSYNFSLMAEEEKLDLSLAGLRKDSDWLIDAAFSDASRMRNRVLMDVWDDAYDLPWNASLSGATKGRYAEVFVNGKYKGLYALGEKQDREQTGLAKAEKGGNGVIFKTNGDEDIGGSPAGFYSLGSKAPGDGVLWYNIEIKFPKAEYCSAETWTGLYTLTALVIKGDDETFSKYVCEYADLDNLATYYLFCNAMNMNDNMKKNMTFVCYDRAQSERLYLLPWDMDASLGRAYSSLKTKSKTMTNRLFTRLIELNVGGFNALLYEKWQALKEGALSLENVCGYFEAYYAEISAAGALNREASAHPTFTSYLEAGYGFNLDVETELRYIRGFLSANLQYWDAEMDKIAR